jgi:lipoprotein signal peptidase
MHTAVRPSSRAKGQDHRRSSWIGLAVGVAAADAVSKATTVVLFTGAGVGPFVSYTNPDGPLGVFSAGLGVHLALAVAVLAGFTSACVRLASTGRVPWWVPGLTIGGALANLFDRAATGSAHDWLEIGPVVVNLADVAVLVGAVGYAAGIVRSPHPASTPKEVNTL